MTVTLETVNSKKIVREDLAQFALHTEEKAGSCIEEKGNYILGSVIFMSYVDTKYTINSLC